VSTFPENALRRPVVAKVVDQRFDEHAGLCRQQAAGGHALFTMPVYGGRTYDDNGYQPFTLTVGRPRLMDVNVTAFSVFIIVLIAAAATISRAA